jgi:hypothetical protein
MEGTGRLQLHKMDVFIALAKQEKAADFSKPCPALPSSNEIKSQSREAISRSSPRNHNQQHSRLLDHYSSALGESARHLPGHLPLGGGYA